MLIKVIILTLAVAATVLNFFTNRVIAKIFGDTNEKYTVYCTVMRLSLLALVAGLCITAILI